MGASSTGLTEIDEEILKGRAMERQFEILIGPLTTRIVTVVRVSIPSDNIGQLWTNISDQARSRERAPHRIASSGVAPAE
jgi:hypothetical protein